MNEYMTRLYELEMQKTKLLEKQRTSEVIEALSQIENKQREVREKYFRALGINNATDLSALRKQENDLKKILFDLRYRQSELAKDPESRAYQQNSFQIRVVRRELARVKFDMVERGKKR